MTAEQLAYLALAALESDSLADLQVLADAALASGAPFALEIAGFARSHEQAGTQPKSTAEMDELAKTWQRSGAPRSANWCTGSLSTCKCSSCSNWRAA